MIERISKLKKPLADFSPSTSPSTRKNKKISKCHRNLHSKVISLPQQERQQVRNCIKKRRELAVKTQDSIHEMKTQRKNLLVWEIRQLNIVLDAIRSSLLR